MVGTTNEGEEERLRRRDKGAGRRHVSQGEGTVTEALARAGVCYDEDLLAIAQEVEACLLDANVRLDAE